MLFLVNNRTLTQNRERTYLTAAVAVAGTTLTVRAIDASAWADNDWLIVGEIGSDNAEVLQVNGAVSNGTSLTVDNAGSGGARYAHSADEPVYRIDYNQVVFYRAATESGTPSALATVSLMPSDMETRYEDTSNTTGYGFVRFKNSLTGAFSPYSDAIPYAGQSEKSLTKLQERVRTILNERDDDFVTDDEITEALNSRQRDIINERLWTFNEVERSQSSVADQFDHSIDSDIKTLHTVRFNSTPLKYIGRAQWERFHFDTDAEAETPDAIAVWNNSMRFYPRPSTAANSTTLNGNVLSTDTSIVVTDISGFKRADYYRFIVNSEVIYATAVNTTTNTFSGCLRGREGTTAAAHTSGDTVTERNIVYTGQLYATNLADQNDETIIPEPDLLAYGAAAELANGKLKDTQRGDRFELKFTNMMKNLRDRFSLKFTSQMGRVKVQEELGYYGINNPNDTPENVTAT